MFRPSYLVAGAAILLSMTTQVGAQFFSPLVDFEDVPLNSAELSREMFRIPETAPTTAPFIVANPPGLFTSNAAFRSDQFPITDFASMRIYFSWVNPADATAWLRLQTFNADVRPNPSVHLGGKVRFKLVNVGDFFDGQFGICLGIRETGANVPQLEDGGSVGDIEWVGVTGTTGTAPDLRPVPAYANVPVSASHVVIEFDLATGHTWVGTAPTYTLVDMGGGVAGFTGDGVLDGTRGTIEHIAIINNPADPLAAMSFYIDDLQTEAPVPDPVFPPTVQSPIIQGDVTVTVSDLLSTADQVTLFRDAVFVETKAVVDPNLPLDFTIAPAAVAGECFTATQRESISGDTSVPSTPVCTLPAPAVYTFNVCLDENGSNCSLDWEMVPAASRGTAPNGEIAPHGQVIFPNNAVWQTIDIPVDIASLVTNWLGGDGVIAPGGTGLFSLDSIWFTSLGGTDALGNHEVFIDAVQALDAGGALLAPIYSFEDGTNYMVNTRGQSNSVATSSLLSSLASFDGQTSHRIEWSYSSSTVDDTLALYNGLGFACGTAPTFPDATKTIRVRLLARTEYTGAAPQPAIASPIVGNQTSVRVLNDPSAVAVQLYINGVAEGGPVLPAGPETDFAGLTLNPGDSVSATQVVAGETSDFAYPVAVSSQPFPPTTAGPIFPLSTQVTVTGLATAQFATASLVEVFVNSVSAGTAVPSGDSVVVTVPALNTGDVVEARQTVNGAVSGFSNQVIVSFPAPTIYYVPVDGETIVTVTGIEPTATEVTVTVNGAPFSTPYDPMIEPFEVTVPVLVAGQQVVAKYSAGAIDSGDSTPETVSTSTTTEIFCDDFESYVDQAGFNAVWAPVATQMILSTNRNATLGGSKSAHAPDRNYRSSAGNLTGVAGTDLEPAIFSINILDPSGSTGINQYADLNNLATDFFLAEIGISNLAGDQTHYQARLVGNGGAGWFQLDKFDGPTRSAGWHNFTMVFKGPAEGETTGHELDIYVDGLLAAKNIVLGDDTVLREPRIGAGLSASGAPEGYFDDYCFYTGPLAIPALPPVPPSVGSPIQAGDTTVTVNNIAASATLVTVYANGFAIGSIDPAGAATIAVPVTSLVQYDTITATQFTTSESVPSSGLEVGNGNGDIFLSIGVRETGDAGPLGSPGTGTGTIEWIGTTATASGAPNGILVSPQAGWQTLVFDPAQAIGFTGDGVVDGTRGVLEHLAVAVDSNAPNRSSGAYQMYVDNVVNVGAGAGGSDFVITDFESFPLGDEALFQEPGNSGSTSANSQFPPDFSETVGIGNPGQSQSLGWFWIDTQPQRWQRISTGAVANVPSPIIDLTRPIRVDVLLLPPCSLKGDVNADGVVNLLDVDAYVLALLDPAEFAVQHPFGCIENADVNNSGTADGDDSQPFVQLLTP